MKTEMVSYCLYLCVSENYNAYYEERGDIYVMCIYSLHECSMGYENMETY